jgi:hypothetical protein
MNRGEEERTPGNDVQAHQRQKKGEVEAKNDLIFSQELE